MDEGPIGRGFSDLISYLPVDFSGKARAASDKTGDVDNLMLAEKCVHVAPQVLLDQAPRRQCSTATNLAREVDHSHSRGTLETLGSSGSGAILVLSSYLLLFPR